MKRSEINKILVDTMAFIDRLQFKLPAFAHFTPEQWAEKGHEYDEIRDNMLGWDVTDHGLEKFDEIGLTLFTIRNGKLGSEKYPKPYAEKLLIVKDGQVTPEHFHFHKMEDIINRGGGDLMIKVYNSDEKDEKLDTPVLVNVDGRSFEVPAGTTLRLKPGESITLPPRQYHTFWAEDTETGLLLVGEVSMVNDDVNDNRYYEDIGRFPTIEEDEPPVRLLCTEYPSAK